MLTYITANNFISGVLASLLATLIVALAIRFSERIKKVIFNHSSSFSIDGYWIATFQFKKWVIYEVVKINTYQEDISIKYQSYRHYRGNITYFNGNGSGLYRAGYIFCPYNCNPDISQAGVYCLRHYSSDRDIKLAGYFLQTHSENTETGFYQDGIVYTFIAIENSLRGLLFKAKFMLGRQVFLNPDDLTWFIEREGISKAIKESQSVLDEWNGKEFEKSKQIVK